MKTYERALLLKPPTTSDADALLEELIASVRNLVPAGEAPIRFAITSTNPDSWQCDLAILAPGSRTHPFPHRRVSEVPDIFAFHRRLYEDTSRFTAVMVVPTGAGCEIGGHAGDAAPTARLLSSVCDELVLHPNVVNAADIIDLPQNCLYVEGSTLCRLLMGTVGLQRVRSNRVLAVIDGARDVVSIENMINAVHAASATSGLDCAGIVVQKKTAALCAEYTDAGRAGGKVDKIEAVLSCLQEQRGRFDAVALATGIDLPRHAYLEYLHSGGALVNPIGGVEAICTHALSLLTDLPVAHAPMFDPQEIAFDVLTRFSDRGKRYPGVVDPRIAAEAISAACFYSVLHGLHRSPRLVTGIPPESRSGLVTAANISCLVIPDGSIGLPTLAALRQSIPVIAVRENRSLLRGDLDCLPWEPGQFFRVDNYWEAAGLLAALREGIAPASVRRPLDKSFE